jgi:subtilisin family serine protease
MRRSVVAIAVVLALGLLLPVAAAGPGASQVMPADRGAQGSDVVVTLRERRSGERSSDRATSREMRTWVRRSARRLGVTPTAIYPALGAVFSTTVTPAQRAMLERDRSVLSVDSDAPVVDQETADALPTDEVAAVEMAASVDLADDVELTRKRQKISGRPMREELPRQRIPIWLKRIGARRVVEGLGNHRTSNGFDADVAIIDSGISKKHPDVTPAGGKDCSKSGTWGDGYGHGTGVASILGARDNRQGIVGLLPGVRLWSVRIFDDRGRGSVSGVLCALDWIAGKRDPRHKRRPFFEGATMSFAVIFAGRDPSTKACGKGRRDVVHDAVCRVADQGTIMVAAAGNYGDAARQRAPAAYPEVITVSAMADFDGKPGGKGRQSQACLAGSALERDDAFTTFSSYGKVVDLIAPGKCIWVATKGGSYARVAGTSFSTPIVLAVALRYRQRYPSAQPNQVRMALVRAGRRDWRVGTDPDDHHEPRVDMRHLRKPPTFRYERVGRRAVRRTGGGITVRLQRDRLRGHTAEITVRKVDVPAGIRVLIDGSRLRIKATLGARIGRQHVELVATDGELRTHIKVPILVRR